VQKRTHVVQQEVLRCHAALQAAVLLTVPLRPHPWLLLLLLPLKLSLLLFLLHQGAAAGKQLRCTVGGWIIAHGLVGLQAG
jgi:hypothetical protein